MSELDNAIRAALLKVANRIREQAINEAPYKKGYLKKSISVHDEFKDSVIISAGDGHAPYAAFVHEGTRPHVIRPKDKKALADKKTGRFFGRKVQHPGTKPNPFMLRAAKKTAPEINRLIGGDVERAVSRSIQGQLKEIKIEIKL